MRCRSWAGNVKFQYFRPSINAYGKDENNTGRWSGPFNFPRFFFYLTFTNSKDCHQLVIDTYEIHSGIMIPNVTSINCYYDAHEDVRISVYELHDSLDRERFINVDRVDAMNHLFGNHLLMGKELPLNQSLQMATGKRWGRAWTYLYEAHTGRLWAELKY